jgi:hypothetical protein
LVRDFVLRARIEAIDRNEAAVAALPTEAREEQRRGYLEARSWDARRMDDAPEKAEFLCRRMAIWTRSCANDRRAPSSSFIGPRVGHRAAATGR